MDKQIDRLIKDGTPYYELYCKCPNCVEVGKDVPPSLWHHEHCDGEIYVGENAHLYCRKCGRERHIMYSAFKCPDCCKVEDEVVDLDDSLELPYTQNNIILGQVVDKVGIRWLINFLKNL